MIGFFPDPYPDELLYSVCARYACRTAYPNKQSVNLEIFGSNGFSSVVDFPNRLEKLISVLPQGHLYSVDKLISENTLLPFHEPFLPVERIKIVRKEMRGKEVVRNKLQIRLGTKVRQIKPLEYLRYCPKCVLDDINQYGETFWHRIHQLSGIIVCSKHLCFLENSPIEWGRMSASFFHNAEIWIPEILPDTKLLDRHNKTHQMLIRLAEDAEWLLRQDKLQTGSQVIQSRYFNSLLEQGFAYYNGRIRHTKFIKACQDFFPPELFDLIGRISKTDKWLSALAQTSLSQITYHPIRHLLLMSFLGFTAEKFFTGFVEFKPFLDPPYPCLNQASNHYREMRIQNCKIFNNLTKDIKSRCPIAVFECDCGFIYQRLGPDKSKDDKFRYSSVREYGKVWTDKFTELWADTSISSAEIGRKTGISSTSVGRHAIRLNLSMNTEGTRSLTGYLRHRNPKDSFSTMRKSYREQWIQTRLNHPNLTRQELMEAENFFYLWLRRNDSEWLEKNLPEVNKISRIQDHLDWKKIDKELFKKIKKVCFEIRNSISLPVRVSITEIIKRTGNKKWIDKRKKKLPLTTRIIEENLETLEDFIIRKIEWTKNSFIAKRKIPTLLQFKVRAVIRNKTSENSSKIQIAIETAMLEIQRSIS